MKASKSLPSAGRGFVLPVLAGVLLGLAVYTLRLNSAQAKIIPSVRNMENYLGVANSSPAESNLRGLIQRHQVLLEDSVSGVATTRVTGRLDDPGEAISLSIGDRATSGSVWERRFRRTRYDLVLKFLGFGERVRVEQLVRHVLLNRGDAVLLGPEIELLDHLVSTRRKEIGEMMENYRLALDREMRYLAKIGAVQPISLPPPDEKTLARFAAGLRSSTQTDPTLGSMSAEEVLAYVKRYPPNSAEFTGESFFTTFGGGTYLYKQFPVLPHTDAMFEDMKFFLVRFLSEVCMWFQAHGYASPMDIRDVMERAANFSAKELRNIR